MKHYYKITPEGTRDLLFEECCARNKVTEKIRRLFLCRGFDEVMTPSMEFYDLFSEGVSYLPQETMFKLIDSKGRLMVLRPDSTIPIARLISTRLQNYQLPIRLFYHQTAFRVNAELSGKSNEIPQIGVELIGNRSPKSDLEIIELAANCLKECTNDHFRIELCHIGFFKTLMESLNATEDVKESIRELIEQKNYPALADLLDQFGEGQAVRALKRLPRLFGGEEVFEEAKSLFQNEQAYAILDYLRSIFQNLSALGLRDRVIIDLGLVNQADYYTGVIFRGYVENIGEPLLSGGRYDNLVDAPKGGKLPATGFAVNVDLLAKYYLSIYKSITKQAPDLLVYSDDAHYLQALEYIEAITREGKCCENSLFDSLEESIRYARASKIPEIHHVGAGVEIIRV